MSHHSKLLCLSLLATCCNPVRAYAQQDEAEQSQEVVNSFQPDQSKIPVAPPEGAIVLFDGESCQFLSKEGKEITWPIENGELISSKDGGNSNHIVSKFHFRDADIHVEFAVPESGSGNSGIYIHGNYELQILKTPGADKKLSQGDVGSVYGFAQPLVNAGRKPGEWQVYDIRYRAPRRNESGEITEEGSITAWLNGSKVQDATRVGEPRSTYHPYRYRTTEYLKTIWQRQKKTMTGPLFLQDHGNPVRFRNVWIKPLDEKSIEYKPDAR